MSFLNSLPSDAVLLNVFKRFSATAKPLLEYHEILLRGPSPLSVADRELIAAFVSGLNACGYCHGVHEATARQFGIPEGLMVQLIEDVDRAVIDEKIKPILRYVRKLTLSPSRMTQADADAVFAVGWDDQALHDAVATCALFNFMNRLVEGLGIKAAPDYFSSSAKRLHDTGYSGLLRHLQPDDRLPDPPVDP
ncbi:MAG TPA: peroxidase-related enzyme [Rhodocyclaceae bacterium]|nr:peroxidase-related enzyme [Rhodocyclaceae bacterium]